MKHPEHEMHPNSLEAYHEEQVPTFQTREAKILELFKSVRVPMTDRCVMRHLGFSDPNNVRPRITELIDQGYLQETGRIVDSASGKKVRLVAISPWQPELF